MSIPNEDHGNAKGVIKLSNNSHIVTEKISAAEKKPIPKVLINKLNLKKIGIVRSTYKVINQFPCFLSSINFYSIHYTYSAMFEGFAYTEKMLLLT